MVPEVEGVQRLQGSRSGRTGKAAAFFTFLTILPPIGSLLTSLANKNQFSPVTINGDDSVVSSVVKNK